MVVGKGWFDGGEGDQVSEFGLTRCTSLGSGQ